VLLLLVWKKWSQVVVETGGTSAEGASHQSSKATGINLLEIPYISDLALNKNHGGCITTAKIAALTYRSMDEA